MIWQPAVYHGVGKRRNFFEGWYFKLTDATVVLARINT